MMLDLDNLKQINDAHGHPAGDAVLIAVSERFRQILGDADVLARYGGDEFALLTFDADGEEAVLSTAGRLVNCLHESIQVVDQKIGTTVSIGVAIPAENDRGTDHLLQRADRALYRAKGRGRDQYSL